MIINIWHIENIVELCNVNKDLIITFMVKKEFHLLWQCKANKGWLLYQHLLCIVDAPLGKGMSATRAVQTLWTRL